jgi:uncharacterized membrane protein YedE/YeeE
VLRLRVRDPFLREFHTVPRAAAIPLALLVLGLIALGSNAVLDLPGGRNLSISLLLGAAFGFVLQRGRFCFFCNARDLIENREAGGVISLLVALAVGVIGYAAIFGAWLPVPAEGRLPPTAHIGPVSPALAVAAFVFGVGMSISGSCLSAHLYRLGEGSPTAPFALIGAAAGFVLGFLTWNSIYLQVISSGPVMWLPHTTGYAGYVVLSLAVIAALAALAFRFARTATGGAAVSELGFAKVFSGRWPPVLTGVIVGLIATLAYLRVAPLGVTAELGSLARTGAASAGLLPDTLFGLDGFRGCATAVRQLFLSDNGLFVAGLVGASFAAALLAGQFKPTAPSLAQVARGLTGGVLMGWGAMTALGCTVGVLLSGIHAGAVAGWVFLVFCFAGMAVTLRFAPDAGQRR